MSFIVLRGNASQWRGELTGYCPMAASWQRRGGNGGAKPELFWLLRSPL